MNSTSLEKPVLSLDGPGLKAAPETPQQSDFRVELRKSSERRSCCTLILGPMVLLTVTFFLYTGARQYHEWCLEDRNNFSTHQRISGRTRQLLQFDTNSNERIDEREAADARLNNYH
ncbi:MAG: hypothetical protein SGJ27_23820 [Candidatus Melainabacteria bacterium]|nr:hypothetical protein [Candidatus Melainabacteria bacterium]